RRQAIAREARRYPSRCRAAVLEPRLALCPPAGQPLGGGPLADAGGLGRHRQRPTPFDAVDQEPAALPAGAGISVELHPGSPCSGWLDTPSLQGGPDEQRSEELQLAVPRYALRGNLEKSGFRFSL